MHPVRPAWSPRRLAGAATLPLTLLVLLSGCDGDAARPLAMASLDTDPYGLQPEEPADELGVDELAPETGPAPVDEIEPVVITGPRERSFRAERGESVGLYATWTGLEEGELLGRLGLRRSRHLRAGRTYTLTLDDERWGRFVEARTERAARRRADYFAERHLGGVFSHTVVRGDSGLGIAKQYDVPLWLLAETNPAIDLYALQPGRMLDIPKVAAGATPGPANRSPLVAEDGGASARPTPLAALPPNRAPAAAAPELEGKGLRITIKPGETLGLLSKLAGVRLADLVAANGIGNPDAVHAGAVLRLPIDPDGLPGFLEARQAHEARRKAVRRLGRDGLVERRAQVPRGETPRERAQILGADEAWLEVLNPGVDPDAASRGAVLRFALPDDKN